MSHAVQSVVLYYSGLMGSEAQKKDPTMHSQRNRIENAGGNAFAGDWCHNAGARVHGGKHGLGLVHRLAPLGRPISHQQISEANTLGHGARLAHVVAQLLARSRTIDARPVRTTEAHTLNNGLGQQPTSLVLLLSFIGGALGRESIHVISKATMKPGWRSGLERRVLNRRRRRAAKWPISRGVRRLVAFAVRVHAQPLSSNINTPVTTSGMNTRK